MDLGATRQATGANEPKQEMTKAPDGERHGEKRPQASCLVPSAPRAGSERQTTSERRWGAGPSGTPFVSWAPREETGVHIGPAPLDRGQHSRGRGSYVCFSVVLLGLLPTRSISSGGLDGSPALGMLQMPLVAA